MPDDGTPDHVTNDAGHGRAARRGRPRRRSVTAPADRTRRAEPARFAAYTLLRAVADGAYANLEMPAVLRRHRLEGRDAAFATELAFGTIRWQGFYDAVVAEAAGRPTSRIDPQVLDVLRLGSHQLLGMRVATHAAADQTVGLARAVAGAGASGFVNAVMRRISERTLEQWREAVVPEDGGAAALAVRHSHPEWVVTALRAALLGHGGPRRAPSTASSRPCSRPTTRHRRCTSWPGRASRPSTSWSRQATSSGAGGSPIGAVLLSGEPGDIAAVRDGRAAVQDEGSQLVALALATAETAPGIPARWLDLCAGPGGKAGVLGALARPGRRRPRRERGEPAPGGARALHPQTCGRAGGSERPQHRGAHGGRAGRRGGRARGIRPGSRRRPLHRARGAAAASGGEVATIALRRGRAGPAAARPARLGPRRGGARWGRRVCHLQSPRGRDPVRRPRRPQEEAGRGARRRTPVCSPTRRGPPWRRWARGPSCSSGRTCTGTDAMFFALLRRR